MKFKLSLIVFLTIIFSQILTDRHIFIRWGNWQFFNPSINLNIGSEEKHTRMQIDLSATVMSLMCQDHATDFYKASQSTTYSLLDCGHTLAGSCLCVDNTCTDPTSGKPIYKDMFRFESNQGNVEIEAAFTCTDSLDQFGESHVRGIVPFLVDDTNSVTNFSGALTAGGYTNTENLSFCRDRQDGQVLINSAMTLDKKADEALFVSAYLVEDGEMGMGESAVLLDEEQQTGKYLIRVDLKIPHLVLPEMLYNALWVKINQACENDSCPVKTTIDGYECYDNSGNGMEVSWTDNFPTMTFDFYGRKLNQDVYQYGHLTDDNQFCMFFKSSQQANIAYLGWVFLYDITVTFDVTSKNIMMHDYNCNDLKRIYELNENMDEGDLKVVGILIIVTACSLVLLMFLLLTYAAFQYVRGVRADLIKFKKDPNNPIIDKSENRDRAYSEYDDDNHEDCLDGPSQMSDKTKQKKGNVLPLPGTLGEKGSKQKGLDTYLDKTGTNRPNAPGSNKQIGNYDKNGMRVDTLNKSTNKSQVAPIDSNRSKVSATTNDKTKIKMNPEKMNRVPQKNRFAQNDQDVPIDNNTTKVTQKSLKTSNASKKKKLNEKGSGKTMKPKTPEKKRTSLDEITPEMDRHQAFPLDVSVNSNMLDQSSMMDRTQDQSINIEKNYDQTSIFDRTMNMDSNSMINDSKISAKRKVRTRKNNKMIVAPKY